MTTAKRKVSPPAISGFVPMEQDLLKKTIGGFTGKQLAEAIHDMATEHFRRVDESETNLSSDKEAEETIKVLFDKHTK